MGARIALLLIAWLAGVPGAARGVIISAGDGTGNTTPPADDPGFYNVGSTASASAIYLWDGWVLTANHVTATDVTINGVVYPIVPGSSVGLTNPTGLGQSVATDLKLYRIVGDPGLPRPTISAETPITGSQIVTVGVGANRDDVQTYWTNAWVETSPPASRSGYKWDPGRTLRWGMNVITDNSEVVNVGTDASHIDVNAFVTRFDQAGLPHESQAALGDSGGAAFYKNPATGQWELAGMIFAVSTLNNQPSSTSVFTNLTYYADLSIYRDQILTINPYPGDLNVDFAVDIFDVAIVSNHWGAIGEPGTVTGDANRDGIVDIFDIALISNNWTSGPAPSTAALAAAIVPEPATLAMLPAGAALGTIWFASRRRKALGTPRFAAR